MFPNLLLFFIGFYILVKGADLLVKGSSSLASKLRISDFVIGLTVVGIGTSVPEFAVAVFDSIKGGSGIGLGTVVGSNTFNILGILGLTSLFFTVPMRSHWVERDLIWNMLAVLAVVLFALPLENGSITQPEAVALLTLFCLWLFWVIAKANHAEKHEKKHLRLLVLPMALFFILAGLLGVVLGGNWVVAGAKLIAQELGLAQSLIGLTIVGIGTSLPELAATFMAALRHRPGIAIGNVIGSNIFDFLMIIGAAGLIKPVVFPAAMLPDILVTLGSTVLLFAFAFLGRRHVLNRWQGTVFILLYIGYLVFLFQRG